MVRKIKPKDTTETSSFDENNLAEQLEKRERARQAVLDGVAEQLDSPETRYVRNVYERLLKAECTDEYARNKIAGKLEKEMLLLMRTGLKFDDERYKKSLEEIFDEIGTMN